MYNNFNLEIIFFFSEIELLEQLCFKGKTHVKRGQGFMSISKKAIEINNTPYITEMVHQVFINRRNNYDC